MVFSVLIGIVDVLNRNFEKDPEDVSERGGGDVLFVTSSDMPTANEV